MLKREPIDRIDIFTCLSHPFFEEAECVPSPSSGLLISQWDERPKEVINGTQQLMCTLELLKQMYIFGMFLKQSHCIFQTFVYVFSAENHNPEEVNISLEEAQIGLSHILGDLKIAEWFIGNVKESLRYKNKDQAMNLEESDSECSISYKSGMSELADSQKMNLKDLMKFYIELYLGQIDHEFKKAFMLAQQLQTGEFLVMIQKCLRKGLNIRYESDDVLDYTKLKHFIYLHCATAVDDNKE